MADEPPSDCPNPNCREPRPHEHYVVPDPENEGNWITASRAIEPPIDSDAMDKRVTELEATVAHLVGQVNKLRAAAAKERDRRLGITPGLHRRGR